MVNYYLIHVIPICSKLVTKYMHVPNPTPICIGSKRNKRLWFAEKVKREIQISMRSTLISRWNDILTWKSAFSWKKLCKYAPRSELSIECPTSAASMFSPSDGKPMGTDWVVSIMASWVWVGWRDPGSLTIVEWRPPCWSSSRI